MSVLVNTGKLKRKRVKIHPLFLDLGLTGITSAATLLAGLVVVSLFGKVVGAIALAEYLLVRRVYAWIQPGATVGLSSALPRYVALTEKTDPQERDRYLLASIVCAALFVGVTCIVLNVFSNRFSDWFFGGANRRQLIFPLSLMLLGGISHSIVYGYYRGQLLMKRANMLQACNLVAIPVGVVLALYHSGSAARIIAVTSELTLAVSAVFAIPLLPRILRLSSHQIGPHLKELLRYGVPRLPSSIGMGAIFALGPMVAARYLPLREVTYLLLGMSFLTGVSASAEPLGLILLSKVSMVLAQDRLADVRIHLSYLQEAVLACYVFVCLQAIIFADVLVRAWVGDSVLGGILIIRLTLLAIPFYLLHVSLRTVIDAASITPYNTYNIVAAGVVFVVLLGLSLSTGRKDLLLEHISGAIVVSLVVLAWLTIRSARKLYALEMNWRRSAVAVGLSILLAGVSLLCRSALGYQISLAVAVLIGLGVTAIFLFALKQLKSPWLSFFWNLALSRRTANA